MYKRLRNVVWSGAPEDWQKVLAFIFVWGGAVVFLLSRITVSSVHDPHLWTSDTYDVKHGYTWSLILLVLPIAAWVWWYVIARKIDPGNHLKTLMKAALIDTVVTGGLFVIFDAVFATLLFDFPDAGATFPYRFPGYMWKGNCSTIWTIWRLSTCYDWTIPYEEVAFYLGGAAVLRGVYIWASEDFLSRYTMNHEEYVHEAKSVNGLLSIHWPLLFIVLGLLVGGIVGKKLTDPNGGYPVYLILQAVIIAIPGVFLYGRVRSFINTRALLLVMVLQLLVSVIWEVTAAIPYGWWNYNPNVMVGIWIRPWSDLPVEAGIFWLTVGWSAMFLHEATKIRIRSGVSWLRVWFPRREPPMIPDTQPQY